MPTRPAGAGRWTAPRPECPPARRCRTVRGPRPWRARWSCRCTGGARSWLSGLAPAETGFASQRDVFCDRQGVAELHALEGPAEPMTTPSRRAQPGDVLAVQANRAADSTVESAAGVERRRLTGTVRADESGDAAERRGERKLVDRMKTAEANAERFDLQPGPRADRLVDHGDTSFRRRLRERALVDDGSVRARPAARPASAAGRPAARPGSAKKPKITFSQYGAFGLVQYAGMTDAIAHEERVPRLGEGGQRQDGEQDQRLERARSGCHWWSRS